MICLYNTYDEAYIQDFKQKMKVLGDAVLFRGLPSAEFAYLLKQASVYVRATDRDGDAVAIREANSFGVSVVASSIVARPEFCLLFELASSESLTAAIRLGLNHGEQDQAQGADNFQRLAEVYFSEHTLPVTN